MILQTILYPSSLVYKFLYDEHIPLTVILPVGFWRTNLTVFSEETFYSVFVIKVL